MEKVSMPQKNFCPQNFTGTPERESICSERASEHIRLEIWQRILSPVRGVFIIGGYVQMGKIALPWKHMARDKNILHGDSDDKYCQHIPATKGISS